jgi:glycine/D-amino acid oxidase-like deaminating enzyme
VFSESEARAFLAVARAILPGGERLPPAGPRLLFRVQELLRDEGPALSLSYRGLLRSLGLLGRLRYRKALAELEPEQVAALLSRLQQGSFAQRAFLRGLATLIKAMYFDDPAIYALLGQRYRDGNPTAEAVLARGTPDDQPRYVRERTRRACDLSDGETLEADVVVIGSGAGGAVAAYELAAAGHAVLLLEEGLFFGRQDFTGNTFRMQRLLYRDMGATTTLGNAQIFLPTGKTVGGSTTVNSGTCYRVPDRIAQMWEDQLGLSGYGPSGLAPYYERVEGVLGVDYGAPRFLGPAAAAVARGADALGLRHKPLRRNAPDCDGQGLCCFGCPTDAKRSTNVSYVPMALRAGAELVVGARAERLLIEGGRAVGVEGVSVFPQQPGRALHPRFRVRAKAVVLATGTLATPVFLLSDPQARRMLSRSRALGQHLTIHPAAGVFAAMPEPINVGPAIPQSYAIESFHEQGLLFEGAATPADLSAITMSLVGRPFVEIMEQFQHLACFGFMLEDSACGSVAPGPFRRPLVRYDLTPHDVSRIKRGVDVLSRVFFAAGATSILTPVHGFELIHRPDELQRMHPLDLRPNQFDLTAYHPLGTARMGVSPETSVVDPNLQAHDLPGLYICDGSVIPTSPAVNPQLTIMAVVSRAAQRLAQQL